MSVGPRVRCERPVIALAGGRTVPMADRPVEEPICRPVCDDGFRHAYLSRFGIASTFAYRAQVESALDALADHLEAHLDLDRILDIARSRQTVRR